MARVGLVGVPFACGAGRTFGGFGAFGASWRLLSLLGYLLPAKLGVLHAGVCGAGRTFGGFGAFGAFEACQTAAWNAYKKPLLRPGGCLEPLLWPCGGFCLRAWRLLGLLGHRLPAKLGVLHAGVARVGLCAGKRQAATLEEQGLTATGLGATGRRSIGSIVRV